MLYEVITFPVQVFNWWDRGPNGPSLSSVKEKIPGCVMGGIDHNIVNRRTRPFLMEHVREGRTLGGNRITSYNVCYTKLLRR